MMVVEGETTVEEQVDYTHGVPENVYDNMPGTPTQDEVIYSVPDNEIVLTTEQSNIPIVEVSAFNSSLGIGQLVHHTRSKTKLLEEQAQQSTNENTSRPDTPHSEVSEASRPDSIGEIRGRRSSRSNKGQRAATPTEPVRSESRNSNR